MPSYAYKVIDQTGTQLEGAVEASDELAATRQLRQQGYIPLKVREGGGDKGNRSLSLPGLNKVKGSDLTIFSRQFATMISSGLTILRSLMILETQVSNPKLRVIIGEIATDIEGGRSLSDSLEKHPKVFDKLYVSMVRAGELGGVLDMTLQRVATQMEARESLKRKVKSAMSYPIVVLIFALLAMVGMLIWLVPIFAKMYIDLGSELPALTQIIVTMSNGMKAQPWLIPIAFGAPIFAFKTWKKSPQGRSQWDHIKLRIPMKIGPIVQKIAIARFARTLSSLIASGVPMMSAVQVTGESSGNVVIENAMEDVINAIQEGRTFSEPLNNHPIFPAMVIQMAAIGEETGQLDSMLEKVAEFYEDEVDAAVKSLTSIIEPIMMIFIGGVVGFIIIALYMPMFKIFDLIK